MALRQQSAVEFLTTYSFAIFIMSFVLVLAFVISSALTATSQEYSQCNIQPLITCQVTLLTYNSVTGFKYLLVFRNNLNYIMQFPTNAINLTTTGIATVAKQSTFGKCNPTILAEGSQAVCNVTIISKSTVKQGTDIYAQFSLSYNLCGSSNTVNCPPTIYTTTGYSFQTLSNSIINLYNFTVLSTNGIVLINGQSYFSNSLVYMPGGNYPIYGQPSKGYAFNSQISVWTWNGASGSSITPNSIQNSILNLGSNGNVIVAFH